MRQHFSCQTLVQAMKEQAHIEFTTQMSKLLLYTSSLSLDYYAIMALFNIAIKTGPLHRCLQQLYCYLLVLYNKVELRRIDFVLLVSIVNISLCFEFLQLTYTLL